MREGRALSWPFSSDHASLGDNRFDLPGLGGLTADRHYNFPSSAALLPRPYPGRNGLPSGYRHARQIFPGVRLSSARGVDRTEQPARLRRRLHHMTHRIATAIVACGFMMSTQLNVPTLAEGPFEFDGTVTGMTSGFLLVRDLKCHNHILSGGPRSVWNGRPFHIYTASYYHKNVHVVGFESAGLTELVSAQTQRSPAAPRNCTTYSAIRHLEGVLKSYSAGSSFGSLTVTIDTGDDVIFTFRDSDNTARFFGNRRIGDGLPDDIKLGVTRVIVDYHEAFDADGKQAEVVAVRRVSGK